jgi:hypothetical protein
MKSSHQTCVAYKCEVINSICFVFAHSSLQTNSNPNTTQRTTTQKSSDGYYFVRGSTMNTGAMSRELTGEEKPSKGELACSPFLDLTNMQRHLESSTKTATRNPTNRAAPQDLQIPTSHLISLSRRYLQSALPHPLVYPRKSTARR